MCCRIQFCMIHGGVPAIFSVLESSEVKFPALEGFVLPTYFPSRLGNLTNSDPDDCNHMKVDDDDNNDQSSQTKIRRPKGSACAGKERYERSE